MNRWLRDCAERCLFTFVETFAAVLLAGTQIINVSALESAAVAGVAAALAVVKAAAATRVGDPDSAALTLPGLSTAPGVE